MAVSLTLRVVEHPDGFVPPRKRLSFDGEAVSIGRHEDNDLVLPDDTHAVSRCHAVIERAGDGFHLVDHSTNGIWVNDEAQPIDQTLPLTLKTRDRLSMGDYVIEVVLTEQKPVRLDLLDGNPFAESSGPGESADPAPVRQGRQVRDPDDAPRILEEAPDERSIMGGALPRPIIPEDEPIEPPRAGPQYDHFKPVPVTEAASPDKGSLIPDDWALDGEDGDETGSGDVLIPDDALEPVTPEVAGSDKPKTNPPRESSRKQAPQAFASEGPALEELSTEDWRRLGVLLRVFLDGLFANLQATGAIEDGFAMRSGGDADKMRNPLKSASCVEEALVCLFQDPKGRYLSFADAVDDACTCLSVSQEALRDALIPGLKAAVERLDPEATKGAAPGGAGGVVRRALGKSGPVWSNLKSRHAEMRRLLDHNMKELCGRAFSEAYERAITVHTEERRRRKT